MLGFADLEPYGLALVKVADFANFRGVRVSALPNMPNWGVRVSASSNLPNLVGCAFQLLKKAQFPPKYPLKYPKIFRLRRAEGCGLKFPQISRIRGVRVSAPLSENLN